MRFGFWNTWLGMDCGSADKPHDGDPYHCLALIDTALGSVKLLAFDCPIDRATVKISPGLAFPLLWRSDSTWTIETLVLSSLSNSPLRSRRNAIKLATVGLNFKSTMTPQPAMREFSDHCFDVGIEKGCVLSEVILVIPAPNCLYRGIKPNAVAAPPTTWINKTRENRRGSPQRQGRESRAGTS